MKAVLTAVIAAIEAVAVALAGFAVVVVPALLVWWLTFSLGAEPQQLLTAAAGGWLLAHLVPLTFEVDAATALSFGLAPDPFLFTLSLAPLGLTLLTVLLAFRAGWRFAGRGGAGVAGVVGGLIGFAAASAAIVVLGAPLSPWPRWLAVLVPALCYGASTALGFATRAILLGHDWWLALSRAVLRRLEWMGSLRVSALPARLVETLRLAAGALAALIALGALGVAVALVVGYVDVVTLSQGLQLDLLGLVVLFLLSAALLPVACIWAISWFAGAGFAIGTGTSVTPFETLLGPLPAFPLLGAIPQGWGWAGGLAPALVVLLGVGIGALAGARPELRRSPLVVAVVLPLLAAALAGLAVAGLAALATGAIGPGRLADTGPAPWIAGGLAALELGAGLLAGVLARRVDLARVRPILPSSADSESAEPATPVDAGPAANASAETVPLEPLREPGPARMRDAMPETAPTPAPAPDSAPAAAPPSRMPDASPGDALAETAPIPDAPAADEDPLLKAFEWGSEPPPAEEPHARGWRRPRKPR